MKQSWTYGLNAADTNTRQLLVATANLVSYAWVLWVPCKFLHDAYKVYMKANLLQWYCFRHTMHQSTNMVTRF